MTLYADRPSRLIPQLLGDLALLVVVWLGVRLGRGTHERLSALAAPGRDAEASARALDGRLQGAARDVDDAPLVGGALAAPLRTLAETSRDFAATAVDYQDAVARIAVLAAVILAAAPILLMLSVWLPRRAAWVREASAATRLMRQGPAAADLLAVRALARQPLRSLSRLGPEVVAGWKAGDPAATDRLAALELASLGLRRRL